MVLGLWLGSWDEDVARDRMAGKASWEEWQMDLSQYVTDGSVTTDSAGLTNPGGKSFTPGYNKLYDNTTPAITLSSTQFTEVEYSIRTTTSATANLTFCFRLTNAGSVANFTYTVTPQITIKGGARPESGGTGVETGGGGNPVSGGTPGGGSGAGGEGGGGGPPPVGGGGQGGGGGSG